MLPSELSITGRVKTKTIKLVFGALSLEPHNIGGVMVSVHASNAVDRGFEPRSGQTKDYKIGICCFSAKHAALRKRSKDFGLES